ncbi:MAG TPA: SHOCT domain-containing protein [Solirubrobacterales bacterium]|nr:SHOCT domain-containing protein [Solirubrobacterales bacterium]
MPGLLRGMARTAAVAGTATAVSGRVRRRQESRWAQQEAQPAPTVAGGGDGGEPSTVDQLKELAELKSQGILTEEEFAAQKAKILGS